MDVHAAMLTDSCVALRKGQTLPGRPQRYARRLRVPGKPRAGHTLQSASQLLWGR